MTVVQVFELGAWNASEFVEEAAVGADGGASIANGSGVNWFASRLLRVEAAGVIGGSPQPRCSTGRRELPTRFQSIEHSPRVDSGGHHARRDNINGTRGTVPAEHVTGRCPRLTVTT